MFILNKLFIGHKIRTDRVRLKDRGNICTPYRSIYRGWIMIVWAIMLSLFTVSWVGSVVILQFLPLQVTPSAAIANLSMETKASATLVTLAVLFFFPMSELLSFLTNRLAPSTLASTSVTRIVSAVALANLPLLIVTRSASIRQKSEKVQNGGLWNTGVGRGGCQRGSGRQSSRGGAGGDVGGHVLLNVLLLPCHCEDFCSPSVVLEVASILFLFFLFLVKKIQQGPAGVKPD